MGLTGTAMATPTAPTPTTTFLLCQIKLFINTSHPLFNLDLGLFLPPKTKTTGSPNGGRSGQSGQLLLARLCRLECSLEIMVLFGKDAVICENQPFYFNLTVIIVFYQTRKEPVIQPIALTTN